MGEMRRFSAVHLGCYERVWAATERSDVRRVSTGTGRITQHNELRAAILFLLSNNNFRTNVPTIPKCREFIGNFYFNIECLVPEKNIFRNYSSSLFFQAIPYFFI
jgi:hypothetical protein